MHLTTRDLTASAFEQYGAVIGLPGEPPVASGPGWRWWSQSAVIPQADRSYAVGYLDLALAPLQFDWAEYHLRSPETIVPLGGECLIYVGPRGDEPRWDLFEVFRVRVGQGVVLNEGVWHGAPLALDGPTSALVLLRQGTGDDDVYKATRADGPIQIVDNTRIASSGE